MDIYHYHPQTGEFLRGEPAKLDPGEAALGQTRYLIPANATDQEPPAAGENKVAVFRGVSWQVVADYRGTVCYDPVSGEELTITEIDQVPVVTDPPPEDYRAPQWSETEWVDSQPWTVSELREREYNLEGATIHALAVALWERDVEGRPEAAQAIQAKREAVKAKYPKV